MFVVVILPDCPLFFKQMIVSLNETYKRKNFFTVDFLSWVDYTKNKMAEKEIK